MSSPLWEILQELGENPPWLIEVPKLEYSASKRTALFTLFPLRKVGIYIKICFVVYYVLVLLLLRLYLYHVK